MTLTRTAPSTIVTVIRAWVDGYGKYGILTAEDECLIPCTARFAQNAASMLLNEDGENLTVKAVLSETADVIDVFGS